jgi:hypothetical protein
MHTSSGYLAALETTAGQCILSAVVFAVVAVGVAGCGGSQTAAPSAAQIKHDYEKAILALREVRPGCKTGEVVVTISRSPRSSESACVEPKHAAAQVERMLKRRPR